MANRYQGLMIAISVGNEATIEWTDHMVSVESIIAYVGLIKTKAIQPDIFCENYVTWTNKLEPLVRELDFIPIHTYTVWEYKYIHQAMDHTEENYCSVANLYPESPVVITEAGWATNLNGRSIDPHNMNQELQAMYCKELMAWSK